MHQQYTKLFTELVHSAELIAEQVMEYNKKNNNDKGEETARVMRDDYARLYDKIRVEDFNFDNLEKEDYAKILVASFIIANNMQDQITNAQSILDGYQKDLIPKLQRVIVAAEEEGSNLTEIANELFQVKEESND